MLEKAAEHKGLVTLLIVAVIMTAWSAIPPHEDKPHDYFTWFFELFFGFVGVGLLVLTYRRFRFSNLAYIAAALFFVILAIGARYTYSQAPIGFWIRDLFGWQRNHLDRLGHFMQGLTPAILIREFVLRLSDLKRSLILSWLTISAALAISAFYELVEWWTVVIFYPQEGPGWLGHQGDVWDAQWDMFMAFLGATVAAVLLARLHDRSMAAVGVDIEPRNR